MYYVYIHIHILHTLYNCMFIHIYIYIHTYYVYIYIYNTHVYNGARMTRSCDGLLGKNRRSCVEAVYGLPRANTFGKGVPLGQRCSDSPEIYVQVFGKVAAPGDHVQDAPELPSLVRQHGTA